MRSEFDSPWKEILRIFLRSVLTLCFPRIAVQIDWRKPVEFLDKELEQIFRGASAGKFIVDKLVKAHLTDGRIGVLFIHLEVQHRPDTAFPKRVCDYNRRAEDYCGQPVLSLAILADPDPDWRPDAYESAWFGCELRFKFPVCKLLDLAARQEELLQSGEPVGILIIADWVAGRTRQNDVERMEWKWKLTRRLYESGQTKQQVLELYRFIDWLLALSPDLEMNYRGQVHQYEQEKSMPYITSAERFGIEQGLKQGREEGREEGLEKGREEGLIQAKREDVLELLEMRFGTVPELARRRVQEVADIAVLSLWFRLAVRCADLHDFEQHLRPPGA